MFSLQLADRSLLEVEVQNESRRARGCGRVSIAGDGLGDAVVYFLTTHGHPQRRYLPRSDIVEYLHKLLAFPRGLVALVNGSVKISGSIPASRLQIVSGHLGYQY